MKKVYLVVYITENEFAVTTVEAENIPEAYTNFLQLGLNYEEIYSIERVA